MAEPADLPIACLPTAADAETEAQESRRIGRAWGGLIALSGDPAPETVVHITLALPAGAELIQTPCPMRPFISFPNGTVRPLICGARVLFWSTPGTQP